MLKITVYLDEESDKKYRLQQHAAEQQQNKAGVQTMSKIPALTNISTAGTTKYRFFCVCMYERVCTS